MLALIAAPSIPAQETLFELSGASQSVDLLDDLDGDGVPELVAATPSGASLFSGADGNLIRDHMEGTAAIDVVGGGDHSGDGVPDYAAVYLDFPDPWVVVYSGADGSELRRDEDKWAVEFLGDLDGDGFAELVISNWPTVYSSVDGSVLYTLAPLHQDPRATGDLDGDGLEDFAVESLGETVLISGAHGTEIRRLPVEPLDAGQDVDGDGVGDLVGSDPASGELVVFSGASGAEVHRFAPPGGTGQAACSLVGDTDGDGRGDLLVYEPEYDGAFCGQGAWCGVTRLVSGRTGLVQYTFAWPIADDQNGSDGSPLFDLDADGTADFALASRNRVQVIRGAPLFLDLWPRLDVKGGESVTFTTSPSIPGTFSLCYTISVNGVPLFHRIGSGVVDPTGRRVRSEVVPPALGSLDVELIAFAVDLWGRTRATSIELLELR